MPSVIPPGQPTSASIDFPAIGTFEEPSMAERSGVAAFDLGSMDIFRVDPLTAEAIRAMTIGPKSLANGTFPPTIIGAPDVGQVNSVLTLFNQNRR
jgi:hypothetical protein